ncbi:MAG: nickel-dependent hydrogenase large subunit [Anaerolineales bacterium]
MTETFKVAIGPQHPALKEPGHFDLAVDGETVVNASVRLGYAHRGIEKMVESNNWVQNLYLLERVCGICSHTHAMTYALGVEALAGVEAPPRAQAIRTLVAEMERIHSHMLWLGVAAHEAGFETLFMYSWRDREAILGALEALCGNRVNYSVNVLGGVKFDVTDEIAATIRAAVDHLEPRTEHYLKVVQKDTAFLQRTRGIAVMTADQAEWLGVLGPTARASGVARDVRVDAPYISYDTYVPEVIVAQDGDLAARCEVRVRELFESYRLIREILDTLPEGDLTARMKRKIPAGEVIQRVEAPRGEAFYFIKSTGGDSPDRVKVRTPTTNNIATVATLSVGAQLADVPMILAGVDPCFSCNDRMVRVQHRDNDAQLMRWADLRQYGIDFYQNKEAHQ